VNQSFGDAMKIDMMRFRETFFAEAAEHLASIEEGILKLDLGGQCLPVLDTIFRCAHSIKGGAGTFDLVDVVRFTHELESLLDMLRTGAIEVSPAVVELLLQANDMVAALIGAAKHNLPSPAGTDDLLKRLEEVNVASPCETPCAAPSTVPAQSSLGLNHFQISISPAPDVFRRGIDPLLLIRSLADFGEISETKITSGLPKLTNCDPEKCYLAWTFCLSTAKSEDDIRQEFAFYDDNVRFKIEQLSSGHGRQTPPETQTSLARSGIRPPSTSFFGAFLIKRGLVQIEHVIGALDRQVSSQIVLGQLALKLGRMSVDHVFQTLNWAWENAVLFGDAAVRLGYLTTKDVGDLIQLQRSTRTPIGAILVEMGVISHEQVEAEFAIFSRERDQQIAPLLAASLDSKAEGQDLSDNQEMLGDFVAEACEHLEAAEQQLLALEADPERRDALDAIYRAFHTIKGVSSFFNLQDITALSHAAEDLLNVARDGRVVLKGKAFELALSSVDGLKRQVGLVRDCLARGGLLQRDEQLAPLVASLQAIISGTGESRVVPAPQPVVVRSPNQSTSVAAPSETPSAASPVAPEPKKSANAQHEAGLSRRPNDWTEKETVKVDRDRLDNLINVIGELVIGESMVGQEFAEINAATGRESIALPQLNKIVRDLQEMSLSLRMVPVGATFQKMNRIVRDVARRLGKEIQFHTQGDDTEIDKTVVDQIGDPLMHMVRNAADHGIETPAERIAAGKPPQGHVTLRAFHQGGNIFIELEDDGKGLDRNAIIRKAVERGLISAGVELSDAEVCDLIFKPGFSTAKKVTDVSGRGVGMDVVRRNVEALQGSVTVSSRAGLGSIVTIRLPLTLAIVDGLTVGLGEQTYILPLVSVVESFRPRPADLKTLAGGSEVILVRGEAMPLLRLHQLFRIKGKVINPTEGLVVIVEERNRKCALLVDELLGQSQVVIKNLEANFRKVDGIAGATILGNGQVALILDVHGLSRLSSRTVCPAASERIVGAFEHPLTV
jgi:two-component system chemotaxis sensor kinase CheA